MSVLVFYADLLYGDFTNEEYKEFRKKCGSEVYNGAYVRIDTSRPGFPIELETHGWFRMDGTEVPLANVPKELLVLTLLLT